MKVKSLYFPNLTSLRFFAAFAVIIHHIEQNKFNNNFVNSKWDFIQIKLLGGLGVDFFFVLSGFLISYLLLVENVRSGTINVYNFYIKRILRIWPLYYLIIFIGLVLIPLVSLSLDWNIDWGDYQIVNILLFIFLGANITLAQFGPTTGISHSWSVATEEQFYIIWPLLFRLFKNKLYLMFIVIIIHFIIKVILYFLLKNGFENFNTINYYWSMFRVELMAIGGVMAVIIFNERFKQIKKHLVNSKTFMLVFVLICTLFSIGFDNRYIIHETYGILFGIFILNMAINPKLKTILEKKSLKFLGDISYGLYMFHPIILFFSFKIFSKELLENDLFLYPFVILMTIFLSYISFHFMESKFINLKSKFLKK